MIDRQEYERLPVAYDAEVVVLGGGPAGVAAAVGAARAGMKTMLIEKNGYCGGMAVAGMSGAICGLYNSGKNRPAEQIVYGFAGEFRYHLDRRHAITAPYRFGDTWIAMHDPLVWKEVADDLLAESGVRVLFHAWVSDVIAENGEIRAVVIDGKDGRRIVAGRRFIDATGDGLVCAMAGVPFTMGKNG
ncbi:MAG: FAD-dependent oxidoreductase, partial [Desulfovibrionaceae bacterium]|nr:FAD-dependent oxidoreductase [Desulfovibrionaceae bacterium]